MENFTLDIFDDNSKFILKYLEKKKNNTEKFDQFILSINGINVSLKDFMSSALILSMNGSYVESLKEKEHSVKLKLTDEGKSLAKFIKNNETIIINNVIIKFSRLIYIIITGFLKIFTNSIPSIINAKLINVIVKIIVFIGVIIAIAVGILQLIKYYNTGEI